MTNEQPTTMPTKYDPQTIEKGRYEWWLEGKFFEAHPESEKEPYTIVIPPPNVTGKLHLGHAWDTTLQDIMTRMKRMQGYDALMASWYGPCRYCNTSKSRRKTTR